MFVSEVFPFCYNYIRPSLLLSKAGKVPNWDGVQWPRRNLKISIVFSSPDLCTNRTPVTPDSSPKTSFVWCSHSTSILGVFNTLSCITLEARNTSLRYESYTPCGTRQTNRWPLHKPCLLHLQRLTCFSSVKEIHHT